jgi:hypothetical protein
LRSEPCERLETTGGGTTAASSVELVETLRPWVVAVVGFREGEVCWCPAAVAGFRVPGSGVCLWRISGPGNFSSAFQESRLIWLWISGGNVGGP